MQLRMYLLANVRQRLRETTYERNKIEQKYTPCSYFTSSFPLNKNEDKRAFRSVARDKPDDYLVQVGVVIAHSRTDSSTITSTIAILIYIAYARRMTGTLGTELTPSTLNLRRIYVL